MARVNLDILIVPSCVCLLVEFCDEFPAQFFGTVSLPVPSDGFLKRDVKKDYYQKQRQRCL